VRYYPVFPKSPRAAGLYLIIASIVVGVAGSFVMGLGRRVFTEVETLPPDLIVLGIEHRWHLGRVGLTDSADKLASELSSGMRQRVGLARAFALSPKLLLLDEPFGMLDSLTRWELQELLMEVWARTRVTAICVTHDVDEAILLADRVVMMTNGPNAKIGKVMRVDLPRPRSRKALLEHPDYYRYRQEVLDFLSGCERAKGAASAAAEAA
jgi:nitrate/nitrite transport system ATP-binding protein